MNQQPNNKLQLAYQILCDDVRIELGNKLSLMGIFQDIYVQQFPITIPKIAIVNNWRGDGQYLSEVRILAQKKQQPIAVSSPTTFEIPIGGYANNIIFFINLVLDSPGIYAIQTLINSNIFIEHHLMINQLHSSSHLDLHEQADNDLLN